MMQLLVIGGSNSKHSINRTLALYAASLFTDLNITVLNISQTNVPIYSIDEEKYNGIPSTILQMAEQIDQSDFIVLSLAENSSSFNAGFKNIYDWISRIKDRKLFNDKPMLLMATSPGARGGASVLAHASSIFPYAGASIKATFSLPSFYQNFDNEKGIVNEELLNTLKQIINEIQNN
jgi:chromate reductase, NAD(P)H dehydrogenase (quinone)